MVFRWCKFERQNNVDNGFKTSLKKLSVKPKFRGLLQFLTTEVLLIYFGTEKFRNRYNYNTAPFLMRDIIALS